ncbi:LexA family protein [Modicisalibacter radicis]|uniref:LexA family protein n=1 Tax=Halomonas sp. EAR18 TaxID=2518972 RepID=UPI001FCEB275|nr:translesion error-prone DNA polymerase V autoproteolytic subunit [Halomonas sp. EAR18]
MTDLTPRRAAMSPTPQALPYPQVRPRAGFSGFPSPAEDYEERALDLNERLVKNPAATFFMQVEGDSMIDYQVGDGDTLVVDRALEPLPGHIVVALVDGEVVVKRYEQHHGRPQLCSGNPRYAPIPLSDRDCQIWGVVRAVIHEYPV